MTQPLHEAPAILLVDDEGSLTALLKRVVRGLAQAYQIVPCTDGRRAIAELQARRVALVITDYQMPDLDGLQLTRLVKARLPHVPVVMITALATAELQARAQAAGVDRFIAKPFRLEQLEDALQSMLLSTP